MLAAARAPRRRRPATSTLGRRAAGPLGQRLSIVARAAAGGAANELQDRDRHAGRLPGRVDGELRGACAAARCARRPRPTSARPVAPALRLARRKRVGVCPARRASSSSIQGRKSSARRSGNVSSRLPRSPFGSMAMTGHAVDRGLLDQRQAQPGLAAAGHADADGVGHEVARVVEHGRSRAVFPCRDRTDDQDKKDRASRNPA